MDYFSSNDKIMIQQSDRYSKKTVSSRAISHLMLVLLIRISPARVTPAQFSQCSFVKRMSREYLAKIHYNRDIVSFIFPKVIVSYFISPTLTNKICFPAIRKINLLKSIYFYPKLYVYIDLIYHQPALM